jgi:hypothetical protein
MMVHILAIYRPPSMANDIFTNHKNILLDKGSKFIENYMVIGDLNYDILTPCWYVGTHESSYAPSVVSTVKK